MDAAWSPSSWQTKPMAQAVEYPDQAALERVLRELSCLPPLVTSWEIERLKAQLAEASGGQRFLLQGGDCAESFEECRSDVIVNKLKILLKMSLVLVHGTGCNVIRLGRIAGQYAKPRSCLTETRQGVTLPSFRGWLINRPGFTVEERTPDPELLLRGYERAALTINFIRGLVEGGFADFHHPELWDLDFVNHSPHADEYRRIVQAIGG
ncbi:MAG TPA: 3-deoxy-7-phosphoheptulonate synthase, partial [Thermoguttaceae bacterium]|nr:3-deoxy-7-phosphoheptulonate synthase [Thermoguttaceae bacterium]